MGFWVGLFVGIFVGMITTSIMTCSKESEMQEIIWRLTQENESLSNKNDEV